MRQLVPIRVRPSRARFAWIAVMAVALWTIGGPPIIATGSGNGTHEQLEAAENVLARMLEAQENLTSFDLPATARVYVGGRKVLTASIRVSASRPNHVAVRWLGMTIHPRKGLIFVDPEQFVSGDYTLAVLASPDCLQNATQPTSNPEAQLGKKIRPGGEDSKNANRWIVSAVSLPGSACPLRWTLYVDPDTWLIVRAEVITPDSDRCVIEAKYRQAGYRRWEPLSVYAEGSLVLQEFLPDFLASLILGHATQGTPACVHLEFSTG